MNAEPLTHFLLKLEAGASLSGEEISLAMESIISGHVLDVNIESFLLALRKKGETLEEIVAAALVMRSYAKPLSKKFDQLLDTCGTGGDGSHTLNISTLAAIVAASQGVFVAKHGNRSVSSVCGSADLLELLGVKIDLEPDTIERCIEQTNFGFLFAPAFHPATRFAMPARRRIQGKTIFNLLGPLSNPAQAAFQLVGVYEKKWVEVMAAALRELGIQRALVVHGEDGLDEITTCGKTFVSELRSGKISNYTLTPEGFDLKRATLVDLQCSSQEQCKDQALNVLKGDRGAATDIVCLNAGAAIYVAGRAPSIKEGMGLARTCIDNGLAYKKLEQLKAFK